MKNLEIIILAVCITSLIMFLRLPSPERPEEVDFSQLQDMTSVEEVVFRFSEDDETKKDIFNRIYADAQAMWVIVGARMQTQIKVVGST